MDKKNNIKNIKIIISLLLVALVAFLLYTTTKYDRNFDRSTTANLDENGQISLLDEFDGSKDKSKEDFRSFLGFLKKDKLMFVAENLDGSDDLVKIQVLDEKKELVNEFEVNSMPKVIDLGFSKKKYYIIMNGKPNNNYRVKYFFGKAVESSKEYKNIKSK